jgi:hypothetical protein
MLFWLQIAAAVTDLVAATLSFRSAAAKAPPMTSTEGRGCRTFSTARHA